MSDDRRQALGSLESVTFTAEIEATRRLREQLTSPTFAATGRTCEEVLSGLASVEGSFSFEMSLEAAGAFWEAFRPKCGALLFPLPRDLLTDFVLWAGEPVHPDVARLCGPVQGPQPASCLLDEGHRIGWHWNNGTWWR